MSGHELAARHPGIEHAGRAAQADALPAISRQEVALVWIRMAVAYLAVGVALGLYMGAQGDHSLRSVHAHLNVFGWVSLALMGLIYGQYPEIARNRLAQAHFWLQNLGLATMMLALAFKLSGHPQAEPVLGVGSVMAALGACLFAANVFRAGRA